MQRTADPTTGVHVLPLVMASLALLGMFGCPAARVTGASMAPTLEDRDELLVNRVVYRVTEPQPGDIIILRAQIRPGDLFVKRLIAKAADTVRIARGHVYVNGRSLQDDYVPHAFRSDEDWGPQVIPQGYYFVMGDHRNRSWDSRHWGLVPRRDIVGRVELRWWPLQGARMF